MKWNMISTGDIALRKGGSVDPKKHQDEVFELYSIPAFDAGTPEVVAGSAIGSSKKAVQPNDVMISRIVPHIRRACVVGPAKGHRQIASGEWIIFRDERIWPKYLRWQLVGDVFHSAFMRTVSGVGGSLLRARPAEVFKIQIPLPPLDQQKRIARILDAADALRAKRREALAQLDTLTQSIFLDMFGDPATNPKGWPTSTLEELFEIARGGSPRPIDDYITESPDGVNWIMIGDAPEGAKYITATKKKIRPEGVKRSRSVRPGDFLLTNSMSFGRPYIMRTSGCIHDGWLVLSPRKGNPVLGYFYSLLGSRALYTEFSRRAPGATVKNLNIGLVRSVLVPVPPEEKQREYAVHVSAIEAAVVPFERSLERFESLFASLQQRAFRGEL